MFSVYYCKSNALFYGNLAVLLVAEEGPDTKNTTAQTSFNLFLRS